MFPSNHESTIYLEFRIGGYQENVLGCPCAGSDCTSILEESIVEGQNLILFRIVGAFGGYIFQPSPCST